ncbi:MAG TPA: hypothetical protein PKD61_19745, partial [Polyangiaceae bacterium]|nr:hypothetical protein [Polyangiaceae bacterium]
MQQNPWTRASAWFSFAAVLLAASWAQAAESACVVAGDAGAGGGGDAFTAALTKGPLYGGGAAFLGGLLVRPTPLGFSVIAGTVRVFGGGE